MSKEEKGILELYRPYFYSFKAGFYLIIIGIGLGGSSVILGSGITSAAGGFVLFFGFLIIIASFFKNIYTRSKWVSKSIGKKIETRKERMRLNRADSIIFTKASAKNFENKKEYDFALRTWIDLKKDDGNSEIYDEDINRVKILLEKERDKGSRESAKERERALDYDSSIEIWEKLGEIDEAARVRALKAELSSVKVAQKVVHGDEVTKTEIKDSVVSKSNIGSGGDDKIAKLEKIAEMKEKGFIDDDEFKQMKKEILGK